MTLNDVMAVILHCFLCVFFLVVVNVVVSTSAVDCMERLVFEIK